MNGHNNLGPKPTLNDEDRGTVFERIKAHEEGRSWCSNGGLDKKAMTAPYTPPSNVAAWLRKHDIENPKGRDYEALTKAAKRKPVGYWEDAPRGAKFGGGEVSAVGAQVARSATGGDAVQLGVSATSNHPAPSSDSDLYEPVGTVPVVGDVCVKVSDVQIAVGEATSLDIGSRITITGPKRDSPFGEVFDHDRNTGGIYAECFKRGSWRILKRKPVVAAAPKLAARAWRNNGNRPRGSIVTHWLWVAGHEYWCNEKSTSDSVAGWHYYAPSGNPAFNTNWLEEIHDPAEVARLVEEVRKAGLLK